MKNPVNKFILALFILTAPLLVFAGDDKTTTKSALAAQIEQKLIGLSPNTVIVVVDEATNTAFLRGSVSSQADVDRITEMVRSVNGVRVIGSSLVVATPTTIGTTISTKDADVDADLDVDVDPDPDVTETGTTITTNDASLRSAVEEALKDEGITGQSKVRVETKNGIVTLTGSALTEAHADRMVALAQSVPGVVDVQANIQLRDGKRRYQVKPSDERDKKGRQIDEGESHVDHDDDENR